MDPYIPLLATENASEKNIIPWKEIDTEEKTFFCCRAFLCSLLRILLGQEECLELRQPFGGHEEVIADTEDESIKGSSGGS